MPSTKPGSDATIDDYGNRVLRTIQREDQTHLLEYQQLDTNGRVHPDEPPLRVESTEVTAWLTNAWANPGTSAKVDAIKAAYPHAQPRAHPDRAAAALHRAGRAQRLHGDPMRPVLIALLALLLSACDSTSPITPAPDVALMPAGNFWEDPPWGSCSPYPFEACTPNTADVAIMCGQRWGAGFGSVLSCAPPNEPPRALGCLPLIWGREQCMVDIVCPGAEEYPDTGWCCPEEVTPPPPPRTP